MGLGVGRMGMSLMDFDLCTPHEFEEIFRNWHDERDRAIRDSWEQTRMLASVLLQPWSSKRLSPEDVMTFGWDGASATPQHSQQDAGTAVKTDEEKEAERQYWDKVKRERGLS